MDIFFADPTEIPLPPSEVRIRALRAEPYPDARRVRVYLEVDPFQRRPNAEILILDSSGGELANASVIETMNRKMEMTLHLRRAAPGELTLQAVLYYASLDEAQDPAPAEAGAQDPVERTVVDAKKARFQIGS